LPLQWREWAIPLMRYGERFTELGRTGQSNATLLSHGDEGDRASEREPLASAPALSERRHRRPAGRWPPRIRNPAKASRGTGGAQSRKSPLPRIVLVQGAGKITKSLCPRSGVQKIEGIPLTGITQQTGTMTSKRGAVGPLLDSGTQKKKGRRVPEPIGVASFWRTPTSPPRASRI
jgi:hypothetical protein